jgi:hypothetical protein
MRINVLAIIGCVVANIAIGMAWYGVFAQQWMDGHGLTMQAIQGSGREGIGYALSMVVAAIVSYLLALHIRSAGKGASASGSTSSYSIGFATGKGLQIGVMVLLGTIVSYWYSLKPLSLAFIDGGFSLVQFTVFGAIIGWALMRER